LDTDCTTGEIAFPTTGKTVPVAVLVTGATELEAD
jgi:hypothetical protein